MYRLIASDYSLADIERFSALTIRRGSSLESLRRQSSDDVRVVTGAWLLGGKGPMAKTGWLALAERFLRESGSWLAAAPDDLMREAEASGLLEAAGEGLLVSRLEPRPGVTTERLIDELESAAAILAERRARMRETLQARNRTVNSGAPDIDADADRRFMAEALAEAKKAAEAGEVPVGAVLVKNGEILARAGNRTLRDGDPTAHAEMLVLREGALRTANHRLGDAVLYVTLEPCPMCAGAVVQARPARIVFGASDPRMGAAGGALSLFDLPGVNHRPWITRGVAENECRQLLTAFFAARRQKRDDV